MLLEIWKVDTKSILLEGSMKHPTSVLMMGWGRVLMGILDVVLLTIILVGQFLFNLYRPGSKVVPLSCLTFFKSLLDLKKFKSNKTEHL